MLKTLGSVIAHVIIYFLVVYVFAVILRCIGKQFERTAFWLKHIAKIKEDKHESSH